MQEFVSGLLHLLPLGFWQLRSLSIVACNARGKWPGCSVEMIRRRDRAVSRRAGDGCLHPGLEHSRCGSNGECPSGLTL